MRTATHTNGANSGQASPEVSGVYAALLTPVDAQGRPESDQLARLIDFTLDGGVDGLCIGGGTSEYPHFSTEDRQFIVTEAARHLKGRAPFVAAIGAPTVRDVLKLGEHALAQGCQALLLPMPYFFRYDQEDLEAYVWHVARTLAAPCLLYNLAAFTNPLQPATSLDLLQTEPHLVGMKDSGGDKDALRLLASGRTGKPFALMCGADGLVFEALEAGWDGAVSGIASCCPEVLVSLYRHYRAGRCEEARRCQDLLDWLVEHVGRLPFPWSIRVAAEVRGLATGPLPYLISPHRRQQIEQLRTEYERWFEEYLPALRGIMV